MMQPVLSTEPNSSISGALVRKRAKDCMTKDMSPEQWRGLVGGLLEFFGEEAEEPEHADDEDDDKDKSAYELREMELENSLRGATDSALTLALDKDSVREMDQDGRLHVAVANVCKACISPYRGSEIPGYAELKLDPDKIYQLLRPAEELKKAAPSINGVQILRKHIPVNAEDHQPWDVVGAVGTTAEFVDPYIQNGLTIWVAEDIEGITSKKKFALSPGYHYKPVMEPGTFEGEPFEGSMTDIVFNHLAIVTDGRQGDDVVIGDSAIEDYGWLIIEQEILGLRP